MFFNINQLMDELAYYPALAADLEEIEVEITATGGVECLTLGQASGITERIRSLLRSTKYRVPPEADVDTFADD